MHTTDLMTGLITGVLLIAGSAPIVTAAPTTYEVAESKSTLTVHMGKSGIFSFASAGGGTVKVANEIGISFKIVAEQK